MTIRVLELHHCALRVGPTAAAADEVRDFYSRVLGLGTDAGRGQLGVPGHWLDVGSQAQVHLMGAAGRLMDAGFGIDPSEPHVAFGVASVAAARAELERLQVPHAVLAGTAVPGCEQIFLRDPAGNLVELHEAGQCRCVPRSRGESGREYLRADGVVMFADMRGFTPLAANREPAAVVTLLNEYFALLTSVAIGHGASIFSPAGDCLIAAFGVPHEESDAAVRAVGAAREMLARYAWLAEDWQRRHGIETGLGIGINSGEVIAGRIGVPGHDSYTIIGDAVNIAARLSQRARAGEALISARVMRALPTGPGSLDAIELPAITLRGRAEPIEISCIPAPTRVDLRPGAPGRA